MNFTGGGEVCFGKCFNPIRRGFRIYMPEVLLSVFWGAEALANVRRERERHTVSKVAKAFVVRTQGAYALFSLESVGGEKVGARARAAALLEQTEYAWTELFELESLAIQLAPLERLPAIIPGLFPGLPNVASGSDVSEAKIPPQIDEATRNRMLALTRIGQKNYFNAICHEKAIIDGGSVCLPGPYCSWALFSAARLRFCN